MSESLPETVSDAPDDELRRRVAEGIAYAHARLNATTSRILDASAFLYALVELLDERGVVSIDELDARKDAVGERLVRQIQETGDGVVVQDPEFDKYHYESEVEIDCPSLIPLCQAACCKLPWALSKQDIREGIVRWELGRPYLNERRADGYCCHNDRETRLCTIRENRPVPCRAFDCRNDRRIWVDFERRIPNPNIGRPDWPASELERVAESSA
jgi:hypothetical protein